MYIKITKSGPRRYVQLVRRVRDFGFLHGNAKALLRVVQWVLKVQLPSYTEQPKPSKSPMRCKRCQGKMNIIGIIRRQFSSGKQNSLGFGSHPLKTGDMMLMQ